MGLVGRKPSLGFATRSDSNQPATSMEARLTCIDMQPDLCVCCWNAKNSSFTREEAHMLLCEERSGSVSRIFDMKSKAC